MKFESRKLSIEVNGVVFEMKYPTYIQLCEYQHSIKGIDSEKDSITLSNKVGEFFQKLGMEKQYYELLEPSDVTKLIEEFGSKKK